MSASKIQPALTPEEWEQARLHESSELWDRLTSAGMIDDDFWGDYSGVARPNRGSEHALAALALYGQPFGFTQEDLEMLLAIWTNSADEDDREEWAGGMLARVEALLPPPKVNSLIID